MGKKMKLPFLSQSKSLDSKLFYSSSSSSSSSPPWPFPSCGNIKTLSFRVKDDDDNNAFRTFNSAFLDAQVTPPESYFTISSSSRSFSTMSDDDSGDPLEYVIRGLRSDRLFFEPERSSSLLLRLEPEEQEEEERQQQPAGPVSKDGPSDSKVAYKESEVLSMDSSSPYEDFRKSMEEMVEAHGLKDWQGLEELLGCYLKINGKNNHGYIVGAFIDLIVNLSFPSFELTSSTTTTSSNSTYSNFSSPSSPLSLPSSSSLTTPCLSSILDNGDNDGNDDEHDDDDDDDDDDVHDNHV